MKIMKPDTIRVAFEEKDLLVFDALAHYCDVTDCRTCPFSGVSEGTEYGACSDLFVDIKNGLAAVIAQNQDAYYDIPNPNPDND